MVSSSFGAIPDRPVSEGELIAMGMLFVFLVCISNYKTPMLLFTLLANPVASMGACCPHSNTQALPMLGLRVGTER